jgi:hypothetical protein
MSVGETAQIVDLRTENSIVELGEATEVEVVINMGVGDCSVRSGSDELLTAEFNYNVEEWKPSVDYSVENGRGLLTITQPDAGDKSTPSNARNEWILEFSDDVALDISLDMGVGEAKLDLGDLRVTALNVDNGVGEIFVSLVGTGVGDLKASIDGGVGEINLIVPTEVGVRVDAETGIGELRTHGLTKRGGYLVNDAYEDSRHRIEINVDAGVGSITVEASGTQSASI